MIFQLIALIVIWGSAGFFLWYLIFTSDVYYRNYTYTETLSFGYDNRAIGKERVEKRIPPRGRRNEKIT